MKAAVGARGREILAALHFLTAIPVPGAGAADAALLARAALVFPAVGALLGALLLAADRVAGAGLPAPLSSLLVVALLAALTGGVHLGDLAALASGAATAGEGVRTPAGLAAVAAVLLVKVAALASMGDPLRSDALLLAPVLGRWALVVLAYGARPVRAGGRRGVRIGRVSFREFGWASVLGFAVALGRGEAVGLVAVVAAAGLATALRLLVYRRFGGMTAAALGAAVELVEAATFVLLALLHAGVPAPGAALAAR
jgi:adenosylcobinamide-GDP ribazoletransferase